jgi:hypothetical protein
MAELPTATAPARGALILPSFLARPQLFTINNNGACQRHRRHCKFFALILSRSRSRRHQNVVRKWSNRIIIIRARPARHADIWLPFLGAIFA